MASATDFVRLLRDKYQQVEQEPVVTADAPISIAVNQKIPLRHLKVVDLSNFPLSHSGPPGEIASTCPSIQELDLSYTPLHAWPELLQILSQLQALEFLALSGVELHEATISDPGVSFPGLKTLILTGSRHTEVRDRQGNWRVLGEMFPHVKHLVCGDSILPSLNTIFQGHFTMVESVNLSNCGIMTWDDIDCLGNLPHLSILKLIQNPFFRVNPATGSQFQSLTQLNLEETGLNLLPELRNLSTYPSLLNLRIGNTPFAHRFQAHSRMMLLCYFPHLTHLNGAKIDSKEKFSAERNFVREFSAESGSDRHAGLEVPADSHPLVHLLLPEEMECNGMVFARLVSQHGQVLKFAEVSLAPPTEATLHLQTEEGEQATARLPLKAKVKDLKQTCEGLFGIPTTDMKLFYGDHEMLQVMGLEVLRFENKTLGSMGMKDDDIIVVARKNSS